MVNTDKRFGRVCTSAQKTKINEFLICVINDTSNRIKKLDEC